MNRHSPVFSHVSQHVRSDDYQNDPKTVPTGKYEKSGSWVDVD